jgi:L-asparaginase
VTVLIFTTNDALGAARDKTPGAYIFGANAVFALLHQARTTQSFKIAPVASGDGSTSCNVEALIATITRSEGTRVVIVTDTGTMLNTCRQLEGLFERTLVVTGAWKPGPYPDGDAALNLGMAVAAVQILNSGIYVAMNGFVQSARAVHLNSAKDQFEASATDLQHHPSRNLNPEAG